MIHIIKQKGLYQKRSTPASLPPVTVKWTIEDKREAGSVFFYRLHTVTVLGTLSYVCKRNWVTIRPPKQSHSDNTSVSSTTKDQRKKILPVRQHHNITSGVLSRF